MTDTALKNAFLGANSANLVNSARKAATNTQKAVSSVDNQTQDFGSVLDKTAQKYEQQSEKPIQATSNSSEESQTQQESVDADENVVVEETNAAVDAETVEVTSDVEDAADVTTEEPTWEIPETEEQVDEMLMDDITGALEQIIEQIKKILGITDEELLSGMEDLGLQSYDLLDLDHMPQLVTAIAGEDSVISLVANEDLYTALQDITRMVDTQVSDLLDQTELTSEELDVVLQKLQEMETENTEVISAEIVEEAAPEEQQEQQIIKEPIIIREDHTISDSQPAKQYDTLPENQQENLAEAVTKPQAQNTGKDAKSSEDNEKNSKSFGQDNTAQNFQNHFREINNVAAAEGAEGIEKFTSESTENILRQLADMVKIVRNENLTEMELQLHPASLGTVNVSLTTKGGVVTAEFTTQNETVKAAIEAQASQLRANLEEQGVKVEAIEVSVESHQMERNLDKNGDQQQKQSQEQEAMRVQGMRRGRNSINLRAFTGGEELEGEMQGADDATRIAMEIMAANGNTMDLLV